MKAKAKYGQALRLASTTQLTREQWLAIRKLGIGEPMVLYYGFVVDERKHRISSTKIKCTNLGKYDK